jgi:hypothetical protein
MANQSFATSPEIVVWRKDLLRVARNASLMQRLMQKDTNGAIEKVTELTKTEKGSKAQITLVNDLDGAGVGGDGQLEGNEDTATASYQEIRIDQIRNAMKNKGRMDDQKSIVNFRKLVRDQLGYWLGNITDQCAVCTLSGLSTARTMRLAPRNGGTHIGGGVGTGADLTNALDWAKGITAPSAKRCFSLTGTRVSSGYQTFAPGVAFKGNTEYNAAGFVGAPAYAAGCSGVTAVDNGAATGVTMPGYGAVLNLRALATDGFLRPIRTQSGIEMFVWLVSPQGFADLKADTDIIQNNRYAQIRGEDNVLFKGMDALWLDGILVIPSRHVITDAAMLGTANRFIYTTVANGGGKGGQRTLFLGAQALGYAELGDPNWDESDNTDYGNQFGVAIAQINGFVKPKFTQTQLGGTSEDFGVITIDTAISRV